MPQHKSAEKRVHQSKRRHFRNKQYQSLIKTAIKRVRTAQTKETAQAELNRAVSVLDRLAAKGIIHHNKAANQKSKLTRLVNKLR